MTINATPQSAAGWAHPRRSVGTRLRLAFRRTPLYVGLLAFGIFFMVPLVWMLSTSLKTHAEVYAWPPIWIPTIFAWDNYTYSVSLFPFFRAGLNTMFIVVFWEVGRLTSASMAAFAFSRVRFPFRNALFLLVLSTMMIPYYVTLIPQYLLFRDLGWLDTPWPLIVPTLLGGGAFYVFLLRQFFMTIPLEMDEAARIDGCSWFGIYWRIILPLSWPVLGTVAIFTFLEGWNDFFGPVIYLNTPDKQTIAIAVSFWGIGQYGMPDVLFSHLMAISLLITIPPLLVFFFAQRYFIQGIVISGIKG